MEYRQMNLKLHPEVVEKAKADAERRGISLAQHLRNLIAGGPADLMARASNGRYSHAYCGYVVALADEVLERNAWAVGVADWLGDVDELCGWIRRNPYHPEGAARVQVLMENLPAEVTEVMAQQVARA